MRQALLILYNSLLVSLLLIATIASDMDTTAVSALEAQLTYGKELYDFNCAVCHGERGLGLDDARLSFPEDHRYCEQCHRPSNPRRMTLEQMTPLNAFSVGDAPPLAGEGSLSAFPNALALYSYSRATMPRFEPARHTDEEYLAITAYILALRQNLSEVLNFENLAAISLF
jgi:mono/diheme cytochrome c family protein